MEPPAAPTELDVSLAWHRGEVPSRLTTVDGQSVDVVFRGTWSHGLGPDFADAMLLFDQRELQTGAVEIHLRTRGWQEHGHQFDRRYLPVALHVVARHDSGETRRADGGLVPVVDLAANGWHPTASPATSDDWGAFGGASCAEQLAASDPGRVRQAIWHLGDRRLATRAARVEAEFDRQPPAEALYRLVLDALGYSENREPMASVAERLPLAPLEAATAAGRAGTGRDVARGLLLGIGGFLPLAPADAAAAGLPPDEATAAEACWAATGGPWRQESLSPTAWTRVRVRPANHPAARLVAAADLVASSAARGGLLAALLEPLRAGNDPVAPLREATDGRLGEERATIVVVNGLLPLALALASRTGDRDLLDAASGAWERLPATESNARTRRALRQVAGSSRLRGLGGRGQQGLVELDTTLCAPRRCHFCPVALAVLTAGDVGEATLSTSTDD